MIENKNFYVEPSLQLYPCIQNMYGKHMMHEICSKYAIEYIYLCLVERINALHCKVCRFSVSLFIHYVAIDKSSSRLLS
jgi:hypothetical protein